MQQDEDSSEIELAENREDPVVDGVSSDPDKTLIEETDWVSCLKELWRSLIISPQSSPSHPLAQVIDLQLEIDSLRNPPPPE